MFGSVCRVTAAGRWVYAGGMATNSPDAREDTAASFAAVGIPVTEEGKARARAKLAEADARWTPERWDALRKQLGMPTRAA